jgi:pyruvate/2-oxoglutarate dehydrogenase complex dihydrolipoamide dehydrogenase (E3) component
MAEDLKPDVCVVGGGPGGIAVASAIAAEGLPVVLVEKARVGGSNLTHGAVPTQALMAAASVNEWLRRGLAMGVTAAPIQVDFAKVGEHVAAVVEAVAANTTPERLTALGIRVVQATASFKDPNTLIAGDATIRARRFVLATGSAPAPAPSSGADGAASIGDAAIFSLKTKPGHLIIHGATRAGLELAQALTRLGIDTTVIDEAPPLSDDDPELAEIVLTRLRAEGVRVRAPAKIVSTANRKGGVRLTIAEGDRDDIVIDGSHVFSAGHRPPAVDGLCLEAARISHGPAGIAVDRRLRTTNRRVYAIGDAIAGPPRAARAEHEAAYVARSILFRTPLPYAPSAVPLVTATDPALAIVGLSVAAARSRYGENVRVLRYPFIENDRAQVERVPEGMIKVVTTRAGRILGASIVGAGAGEQIAPWSLAIAERLSIDAMRSLPIPYPSRTDVSRRAAASLNVADLTLPWRRRIIGILRTFG